MTSAQVKPFGTVVHDIESKTTLLCRRVLGRGGGPQHTLEAPVRSSSYNLQGQRITRKGERDASSVALASCHVSASWRAAGERGASAL